MYRISDLRSRDVIDISSGKRIGFVEDVELDPEDGRIVALIVPAGTRLLGLWGKDQDYVVPWELVVKVGEDVILIHLPENYRPGFGRGDARREG